MNPVKKWLILSLILSITSFYPQIALACPLPHPMVPWFAEYDQDCSVIRYQINGLAILLIGFASAMGYGIVLEAKNHTREELLLHFKVTGVLGMLTIPFLTYVANEFSYSSVVFSELSRLYVLLFGIMPISSVLILYSFTRKDGLIGWKFVAKSFIIMYAIIILFSLITVREYRLSGYILDHEAWVIHLVLFPLGLLLNLGIAVLVSRWLKASILRRTER